MLERAWPRGVRASRLSFVCRTSIIPQARTMNILFQRVLVNSPSITMRTKCDNTGRSGTREGDMWGAESVAYSGPSLVEIRNGARNPFFNGGPQSRSLLLRSNPGCIGGATARRRERWKCAYPNGIHFCVKPWVTRAAFTALTRPVAMTHAIFGANRERVTVDIVLATFQLVIQTDPQEISGYVGCALHALGPRCWTLGSI